MVREPLRWRLHLGVRAPVAEVVSALRAAAFGPCDWTWSPPDWLLPHQAPAARRLAASLEIFRGALLADSVGLGKTYVALAVARRYGSAAVLAPASLAAQWRRAMEATGVRLPFLSHESLSRDTAPPSAALLVVDEAHRFRNPETRRYHRLGGAAPRARLLLLTATPVVNRVADVVHLVRLFLPDHGLAILGIPSMAEAVARREVEALSHALSALVVARSPEAIARPGLGLPAVSDGRVIVCPTLEPGALAPVLRSIDALDFPTFADRRAADLLRLHLCHRLASSAPAFAESLRRHRAYLEHAVAAARRGESLSRAAHRALVGSDEDLQLELDSLVPAGARQLDVSSLERELSKVGDLRACLEQLPPGDPKADELHRLLAARNGGKTLVFTSAIATALHLARHLGWRRVAVASGRGARIASGAVDLDEALGCFAPRARGVPGPRRALELDTLIATDLASEGLNLQDADAVIHYDLPWTPLRLEQRTGRIARLGSPHTVVRVWWFRPCPALEARLALGDRLDHKLERQVRLGVATSSAVGQARVVGGLFDWRERFGAANHPSGLQPRFAVVRGPHVAVASLRWSVGPLEFRELIALAGEPPTPVRDERKLARAVQLLGQSPASRASTEERWAMALRQAVRCRLADCQRGPCDTETRRLARRLLRLAVAAGKSRNRGLVTLLDAALDRLTSGVPVGPARALERTLGGRWLTRDLRGWLEAVDASRPTYPTVVLDAMLLGDGTLSGAE